MVLLRSVHLIALEGIKSAFTGLLGICTSLRETETVKISLDLN
nr:MAG TPA: hypothetical protein [Caudoviricetes sp.]